ncbi:hypothetical protein ATANTOWER_032697 [Ataeniobius toweri]|uniref:Uncharacterized protein n=1 Tax=Ataeniobius toweri TaxID=208326 RepID=A0ABU7BWQ1_9TELE|nr:hypothetical protein [Ataeniobius toweri]
MKVLLAVLLVAVFWSQEWKSVLSDSIIHIGHGYDPIQVLTLTLSNTHIIRRPNPMFSAAIQHCLLISWPGSE